MSYSMNDVVKVASTAAAEITTEGFAVKARISDFTEICDLFKFAVKYYKNKGVRQWQNGYDLVKIHQNIIKGEMFVIRNESRVLLCTFAVSNQLPDYYPEHLKANSNIWLIKSLCTNRQGTNLIGRKVLAKIIKIATHNRIEKIYLDCVVDNKILESYYKRYGFKRTAIAEHPRSKQKMVILVSNIEICTN